MRHWGSRERFSYSILGSHTQVLCCCGAQVVLLNPIPLFREGSLVACEKCGREHRIKFLVQSRKKEATGA